jgi:hypothetical protein
MIARDRAAETLGSSLVRRWVRLYTFGAPPHARERRRQELACDTWEHERDGLDAGRARPLLALEILGRMVRGVPADIFWRLRLEGQPMELRIPFERVLGIGLLVLAVLIPIAVGIDGYDIREEYWSEELTRLGELSDRATSGNTVFHALAGVGLLAVATAFYTTLKDRTPVLSTFAAFALAAAAVLVFAASAAYQGLNALANQYVEGNASSSVLETSRALAIVMAALGAGAGMTLALGVFALAVAAHRLKVVPRWLILLPVATVVILPASWLVGTLADQDWTWLLFMGGLALLLAWLAVAGLLLLFRRGPRASMPADAAMSTARP